MPILVLGLVLFLGSHSTRLVAEDWRNRQVVSGEKRWKGIYTVVSLVGLVLIAWGYSMARQDPVLLWAAPIWTRHAASLLVLLGFIFISATYGPPNHFRSVLHHPMYAGTALWALGHLLANGMLADLLLFGSFLAWSIAGFLVWRGRDKATARSYPAGTVRGTIGAIVVGVVLWAVFAFLLHGPLIGVRPF